MLVLTSKNLVQYHHGNDLTQDYAVRCLKSSSWTYKTNCKKLEQPNILGGIPAAVLTQKECNLGPCLAVVNYTEVETTDSLTLKGFHDVFFKLEPVAKNSVKPVPPATSTSRLKKLYEEEKGNIFM